MKTAEKTLEENRIDIHNSDLRDDILNAMNDETFNIDRVHQMCVESISPEEFHWWEKIRNTLLKNRSIK